MKHFLNTISPFCFIIFIASCVTPSFLPQTQNVPIFTDKNQLRVNTSLSPKTVDLQAAYSPLNHLGVMANIQVGQRYSMPEIALGGFYPINDILITELYAGGGISKINTKITDPIGSSIFGHTGVQYYTVDIDAKKIFIQPNIGIKFNDKIDLSFSLKTNYWYFPSYYYYYERWEYYNYSGTQQTLEHVDSINVKNGNQVSFEPALTLKTGGKYTKFMLQTGAFLLNDNSSGNLNPYNGNPFFIRFGISVNLDFGSFGEKKR